MKPAKFGQSSSPYPGEKFDVQLGEMLHRAGLLTSDQLAQAMWEKEDNHLRLEEICIEHGWVSADRLYSFIPSQMLRLGGVSVLYGFLSLDQLVTALIQQKRLRQPKRIGELFLEKGWIKSEDLFWIIEEHAQLRQLASPNTWDIVQQRRQQESTSSLLVDPFGRPVSRSQKTTDRSIDQRNSQEIAALIQQLEVAENQRREEAWRNHLLTDEIASYQRKLKDLEDYVTQYRQERRLQEVGAYIAPPPNIDRVVQLQQHLYQTQQALQHQEALNQSLQLQHEQDQQALKDWEAYQQDVESNFASLSAQIEALTTQLKEARDQLQMQEAQAELKSLLTEKESELKDHQARLEKSQAINARLISELANSRQKISESENLVQKQQQTIQEQNQLIQNMKLKLEKYKLNKVTADE
jgi:hypothetical protein